MGKFPFENSYIKSLIFSLIYVAKMSFRCGVSISTGSPSLKLAVLSIVGKF